MSFFGELYLESTLPYLSAETTAAEAAYLERALSISELRGAIIDVGCGHGRHASILNSTSRLKGRVIGVELDQASLASRQSGFEAVRADFRDLPFRSESVAGMFAWYSTPFIFSDRENELVLCELARCLKPGGWLIIQTTPYERMLKRPTATFEGNLASGGRVSEHSAFDAASGRDHILRNVVFPDGRSLSADFFIRYYPLGELQELVAKVGFITQWTHGGLRGEPVEIDSTDLIIALERAPERS